MFICLVIHIVLPVEILMSIKEQEMYLGMTNLSIELCLTTVKVEKLTVALWLMDRIQRNILYRDTTSQSNMTRFLLGNNHSMILR